MTKEELKNKISEHKECCKKLAEEYRQRYNKDNTDKLALNMFYHNVISFNDFEIILATIEDRNSMMMCFSEPPYLTEETVEVDIKRIEELEKENAELKADNDARKFAMAMSEKVEKQLREENAELKNQLEMSNKVYNDNLDYSHHIEEQLTKAKELLERLLITSCNSDVLNLLPNCSEVLRVRVEAEQFLSEVEK